MTLYDLLNYYYYADGHVTSLFLAQGRPRNRDKSVADKCSFTLFLSSTTVSQAMGYSTALSTKIKQENPCTIAQLAPYFSMPFEHACAELRMNEHQLRDICKAAGLKKWPYRKVLMVDSHIQLLQRVISEWAPAQELEQLMKKREYLLRYPDMALTDLMSYSDKKRIFENVAQVIDLTKPSSPIKRPQETTRPAHKQCKKEPGVSTRTVAKPKEEKARSTPRVEPSRRVRKVKNLSKCSVPRRRARSPLRAPSPRPCAGRATLQFLRKRGDLSS